jgi:chromosome segregation ATPase
LVTGKRLPQLDHAEVIAPVFGLDVDALLCGTDAEGRLREFGSWVKRTHYESAIEKIVEFESRCNQLQERLREKADTLGFIQEKLDSEQGRADKLKHDSDRLSLELRVAKKKLSRSERQAKRYYRALERAVARLSEQNHQLRVLAEETASSRRSSRVAAIFAGAAAAAGVITIATLLGDSEEPGDPTENSESSGTEL